MKVRLDYAGRSVFCVVVRVADDDAFVLTAYPTDKIKKGVRLWSIETMADRKVTLWFDAEGDFLEVIFDQKPGYVRETSSDQMMEKVDENGNLLGFSVLRVSSLKDTPLDVAFD